MITVYGEGRGFRVVWLLEEMGLPYRLRPVDMLAGVENDPDYLAINPAGFIPALQDGDTILVESIAIMEYLIARHGPTPLAPSPEPRRLWRPSRSPSSASCASAPARPSRRSSEPTRRASSSARRGISRA